MEIDDPVLLDEMFAAARWVKDEIYGNRLVLFAPLYISNLCKNECLYCAFRADNTELKRRTLTQEEIANEVKILIEQGHKRLLLVAGESYPKEGFNYILRAIDTIYRTKSRPRRNPPRQREHRAANAWTSSSNSRRPKSAPTSVSRKRITVKPTRRCSQRHQAGLRLARERALTARWRRALTTWASACCSDSTIGSLKCSPCSSTSGTWKKNSAVGPHTISVPRMEPAVGFGDWRMRPPHAVSDGDFKKIVAILRLAVPYTGIIMSTRENADTRRATFQLGVSQISAGSRCNPGGYADSANGHDSEQFQLGDHRSLDEVVRDVASLGYTPSFCTACYRLGRTGADFMDLAKPGLIKEHCSPNALSSCMEYLLDYATPETRQLGEKHVNHDLKFMESSIGHIARDLVTRVRANKRDVFV